MKKILTAVSFLAVMAFSSMTMATPYVWTANENPDWDFSLANHGTYSTTLALTGFNVGYDNVILGELFLDFDNSGFITKVKADTMTDGNKHLVVAGLGDLFYFISGSDLNDGKLVLSVTANDIWKNSGIILDDVSLIAEGCQNPVPEPGTLMLLGLGMFGLAVYGKRRMNKEA